MGRHVGMFMLRASTMTQKNSLPAMHALDEGDQSDRVSFPDSNQKVELQIADDLIAHRRE